MFAHSNVSLNAYFAGITRWNGIEISNRGIVLGRSIATIWPRPDGEPYVPSAVDPEEFFEETFEQAGQTRQQQPHTHGNLRVVIHWSILGINKPDETICESKAALTHAKFIGRLLTELSPQIAERLKQTTVARTSENPEKGYRLSVQPELDFLNPNKNKPYPYKPVPNSALFLFTNTETAEKIDDIKRLSRRLGFPHGGVEAI